MQNSPKLLNISNPVFQEKLETICMKFQKLFDGEMRKIFQTVNENFTQHAKC